MKRRLKTGKFNGLHKSKIATKLRLPILIDLLTGNKINFWGLRGLKRTSVAKNAGDDSNDFLFCMKRHISSFYEIRNPPVQLIQSNHKDCIWHTISCLANIGIQPCSGVKTILLSERQLHTSKDIRAHIISSKRLIKRSLT